MIIVAPPAARIAARKGIMSFAGSNGRCSFPASITSSTKKMEIHVRAGSDETRNEGVLWVVFARPNNDVATACVTGAIGPSPTFGHRRGEARCDGGLAAARLAANDVSLPARNPAMPNPRDRLWLEIRAARELDDSASGAARLRPCRAIFVPIGSKVRIDRMQAHAASLSAGRFGRAAFNSR